MSKNDSKCSAFLITTQIETKLFGLQQDMFIATLDDRNKMTSMNEYWKRDTDIQ